MRTKEEITEEIHAIAHEFSTTKQKPFITILQPRRNLKETPAQQLQDWKDRHVDMTSVAVSYHAIDGNPVDVARNWLIEKAIEDDAKYALFIDEDTALPYYGPTYLLETSKQYPDAIITGIYYVKFGNVMISVMDEEQRWVLPECGPKDPLVRNVVSVGMGCCFIPMKIIKKLREQFVDIPLWCIVSEHTWKDNDITFIGEDAWFFHLCRKAGIEVIADPRVQCLHMELATGKYTAHPDVVLDDYLTQIPVTERFTLADRKRVSKDYMDRICKPMQDEPPSL